MWVDLFKTLLIGNLWRRLYGNKIRCEEMLLNTRDKSRISFRRHQSAIKIQTLFRKNVKKYPWEIKLICLQCQIIIVNLPRQVHFYLPFVPYHTLLRKLIYMVGIFIWNHLQVKWVIGSYRLSNANWCQWCTCSKTCRRKYWR